MLARTQTVALAVLLCGAPLYAADTKNVDKTMPLGARGSITLAVHNESTDIRSWDRSDVEVHAQIEQRGTSYYARRLFDETTVSIEGSPDHVTIKSERPELAGWGWGWLAFWGEWNERPKIHYAITAPRSARWQIYEHNGSVRMEGLAGPLELSMHNGYANVDFASFTMESRIRMHNGTAELAMPRSSKFTVDSRGHHMQVSSDFPVTMQSSDFGRRAVAGAVNGGGPELRVAAHNGSLRLRSK